MHGLLYQRVSPDEGRRPVPRCRADARACEGGAYEEILYLDIRQVHVLPFADCRAILHGGDDVVLPALNHLHRQRPVRDQNDIPCAPYIQENMYA